MFSRPHLSIGLLNSCAYLPCTNLRIPTPASVDPSRTPCHLDLMRLIYLLSHLNYYICLPHINLLMPSLVSIDTKRTSTSKFIYLDKWVLPWLNLLAADYCLRLLCSLGSVGGQQLVILTDEGTRSISLLCR